MPPSTDDTADAAEPEQTDSRSLAFKEAVERHIPAGGSLASDLWRLSTWGTSVTRVVWTHRETGGRIMLTAPDEDFLDVDPTIEVYVPAPRDAPHRQDPDDANDQLLTLQSFDGPELGAAVWLAEYYARNYDEMVPEDAPPVDVDVTTQ
jgi:hypothetical protein